MVPTSNTVHVIHCFDAHYVLPAAVCFQTLLENAKVRDTLYCLHVVGDLDAEDEMLLSSIVDRFPNASISFRKPPVIPFAEAAVPIRGHYSADLYGKLVIPDMFPDIDVAIVADVDVVYQSDIAEAIDLFKRDCPGSLLAGVWDVGYASAHGKGLFPTGKPRIRKYARKWSASELDALKIGAGFVVYDMAALRTGGWTQKWMNFARDNAHRAILPEQEAYNIVCEGRISFLPPRFMAIAEHVPAYRAMTEAQRKANPEWDEMYGHPVQMHYASKVKPWKYPGSPCAGLWFSACERAGMLERWRKWFGAFSTQSVADQLAKTLIDFSLGKFRIKLSKRRKFFDNE